MQDHPGLLKSLSDSLAGRGCEVVAASGGVQGMLEFLRRQPDLVILDVQLEGMHGLQLLHEIRERASTPVVLITTKLAPVLSAVDSVVVLRKPFSPSQLMEKIREVLKASRRRPKAAAGSAKGRPRA